jgi:hypothetical protein
MLLGRGGSPREGGGAGGREDGAGQGVAAQLLDERDDDRQEGGKGPGAVIDWQNEGPGECWFQLLKIQSWMAQLRWQRLRPFEKLAESARVEGAIRTNRKRATMYRA